MENTFLTWLAHYGPGVLFLALALGVFGLPIPDELLLTVAGALVRQGKLDPVSTVVAAITGCLSGITLSYVVGRTVGTAALHRIVHVPDAAFQRAQQWFHRFGRWLLMFGYYIPAVRHCTAIAAGSAPLPYHEFALFAYTGGVIWCLSFLSFGYFAGPSWETAWHGLERMGPYIGISLLVVATVVTLLTWRRTRSSPKAG